jgi:FxsC-like protein
MMPPVRAALSPLRRPRRHRWITMAYEFFLSYTRSNYSDYLQRFFDDLSQAVRDTRGLPRNAVVGFFDQNEIELGAEWDETIRKALMTSRVMVGVYSPAYFKSSYCGREWQAFHHRREHWSAQDGGKETDGGLARIIRPLVWMPPETDEKGRSALPAAVHERVRAVQYMRGDPDDKINSEGLAYLLKRGSRFRNAYLDFIDALARSIVASADRYGGLPVPPVPGLGQLCNAFVADTTAGPIAPPARSARHVRFAYFAADPSEFEAARDPSAYLDRGGPDWKPFLPHVSRKIGALVQEIVAAEGLEFTSDELQFDGDLDEAIESALRERKIVVLRVDAWSVDWKSAYFDALRRFDTRNFRNCTVLVPWNRGDPVIAADRDRIESRLRAALHFRSSGNPVYFRSGIETVEQLRQALREVLESLQADLRNSGLVDSARPLAMAFSRPVLSGPGAAAAP